MKKKIVGIFVMMLLIATTVLPVVGTMNIEKNKEMDTSCAPNDEQKMSQKIITPLQLPPFLLQLVNGDWDYWSDSPNLYTIPSGNVGIGTTNPNSKLEVSGTIHSTSGGFKFPDGTVQTTAATGGGGGTDNDWAWLSGSGLTGNIYHLGGVSVGSSSSDPGTGIVLTGPSTGKKTIGFYKGNDWMGQMGYGDVCDSGSVGLDEALGICSYTGTSTLGTAGRTTLTVKDTGYVGIGTTTPSAPLEIYDDDIPIAKFNSSSSRSDIQFLINGDPRGFVGSQACPVSDPLSIGICSYYHLIQFGCPTEVFMTIDDGDVGIGTIDPSYKLDVEGDVQAYAYHTGDIYFQKDGRELWRMFEDEQGLYVENLQTNNIYTLVMQDVNEEQSLQEKVDNLEDKVEDLEQRINELEQVLTKQL